MKLSDEIVRRRFISDHGNNFSVIAPAGVGKTTAIAQRIASIVKNQSLPLDKLIVVTYTQKSAEELRQRTVLEIEKSNENIENCNDIFFGTIHSLADYLLRLYGHSIGLQSEFEIEKDEEKLWNNFLQNFQNHIVVPAKFSSFINVESLYKLAKNNYWERFYNGQVSENYCKINYELLLNFKGKNNANILRFQNNLKTWEKDKTLPFPKISTTVKEFNILYQEVVNPIEVECLQFIEQNFNLIAEEFEKFRIKNQILTFSDLIFFSNKMLNKCNNDAINYFIILDEAQDTDAEQFKFLLKLSSFNATGESPFPGHFCMVGDPQQSIYSDRADVIYYQNLHKNLVNSGVMTELKFTSTMRFGKQIAKKINNIFPNILNQENEQVLFVSIFSEILSNSNDINGDNIYKLKANGHDFESFIEIFKNSRPECFNVKKWSDIAILCPRKSWLEEIQRFFNNNIKGIKTQLHSSQKTYGNFREFCWIYSIITILLEPYNKLEFCGILREIFGVSELEIISFYRNSEKNIAFEISKFFDKLREEICKKSALETLNIIIDDIKIKDRILTIENVFYQEILDFLKYNAVKFNSLLEFNCFLKKFKNELYNNESIDENAIQLYTFHKAKGLEWPVVIIPFVNRELFAPHISFPTIINKKIALNSRQYLKYSSQYKEKNNFERLLYVALTRQKKYTIFIDNFTTPQKNSIKSILQNHPQNKNFFDELNLFKITSELENFDKQQLNKCKVSQKLLLQSNDFFDIKCKNVLYSDAFAVENNKKRCEFPHIYKNWWHKTILDCKLSSNSSEKCKNYLSDKISTSPYLDLAENDIKIFINHKEFWSLIQNSEFIFQEFPFLIDDKNTILEGKIDLILKLKTNKILIIDWKTESLINENFLIKYTHQLAIYKKVAKIMFGDNINISSGIYSTYTGELQINY